MAHYGSSAYYGSDYGEYNFNSYAVNYDYAQVPTFMNYNGHEYNQPYYGYDQSLYFAPDYPSPSYQTIAYSATTFYDPKSIVHDPNYGMTQLLISYSNTTLEFNETEFDEYDPTPYGGGYDIAETYGKPLPPSDKICYPHSGSSSTSVPSDNVPAAGSIIPLPTMEEGIDDKTIKPQNGIVGQTTEEMPQSQDSSNIDQSREVEDNSSDTSEESHHEDDSYSGSGYGSGSGNGYSGGQFDEHEKQVPPQYPSGYGLEAMDLCESLFGYWPCLSKMKKREYFCQEDICKGQNFQEIMWKGTADYLFGNTNPYGGRGDDASSYGGEIGYGYERHYPMRAEYKQVDYADES